jgi:hypothetical protein
MQVHKEGDHWVNARNFWSIGDGGISGSRSHSAERTRQIYDCWTGQRWWGQRSSAMTFPTEEAARQYLENNWERLETAS